MKSICYIFLVLIATVLTEPLGVSSPRLVPQLRIGRADGEFDFESGPPRLLPFRVGKRAREVFEDNQNDNNPKRGSNGHLGLMPFMRTGRGNWDENFPGNNGKSQNFSPEILNYYQKFLWYYLFLQDFLEKQDSGDSSTNDKDK